MGTRGCGSHGQGTPQHMGKMCKATCLSVLSSICVWSSSSGAVWMRDGGWWRASRRQVCTCETVWNRGTSDVLLCCFSGYRRHSLTVLGSCILRETPALVSYRASVSGLDNHVFRFFCGGHPSKYIHMSHHFGTKVFDHWSLEPSPVLGNRWTLV